MLGARLGLEIGESRVQSPAAPAFNFHEEPRLVLADNQEVHLAPRLIPEKI